MWCFLLSAERVILMFALLIGVGSNFASSVESGIRCPATTPCGGFLVPYTMNFDGGEYNVSENSSYVLIVSFAVFRGLLLENYVWLHTQCFKFGI